MSRVTTCMARTVRLGLVAAVVLIGCALALLSIRSAMAVGEIWAGDYATYHAASLRFLDGQPIYADFQLTGEYALGDAAWGKGYVYPPHGVLVGVPFALLGRDLGFTVFGLSSALLLAGVAYAIGRREGLGPPSAALVSLAVLVSAPTIAALATGQLNAAIAALFGAGWVWRRASGYIAVLGAAVKLFPAAGLVWAVRCHAPLGRPLLVGVGLLALSVACFGTDIWFDFITAFRNGQGWSLTWPPSPRVILTVFLAPGAAAWVMYAVAGIVLLASLRVKGDHVAFALVGIAMILPAPDWYLHYMVVPMMGALPWVVRLIVGWRAMWSSLGTGASATSEGRW